MNRARRLAREHLSQVARCGTALPGGTERLSRTALSS